MVPVEYQHATIDFYKFLTDACVHRLQKPLFGARGFHKRFYRRRDHQQKHGVRLGRVLEELKIASPHIAGDNAVVLQIVKRLKANDGHLR